MGKIRVSQNAATAALLAALLTACVTPPVELAEQPADESAKTFSVAPGKANIYVVRTGGYTASTKNLPVIVDGLHRGFLSDQMYFRFDVDPGVHTVVTHTKENQGIVTIDAESGANYFVGYVTKIGWSDHVVSATELSQEAGKQAILKSSLAKRLY